MSLGPSASASAGSNHQRRGPRRTSSTPYSPDCVGVKFCESIRRDRGLGSSHDPHRFSQSVLRIGGHSVPFRGSAIVPTILFFLSRAPEKVPPPVCTKVSHEECGLFWHIAPSADNKAALFTGVRGRGILRTSPVMTSAQLAPYGTPNRTYVLWEKATRQPSGGSISRVGGWGMTSMLTRSNSSERTCSPGSPVIAA